MLIFKNLFSKWCTKSCWLQISYRQISTNNIVCGHWPIWYL